MRGISEADILWCGQTGEAAMWVLFLVASALIFVLAAACGADERRNNQERR
jgi:hypothetical protein